MESICDGNLPNLLLHPTKVVLRHGCLPAAIMSLQRTQSPIADTELAIGETYRPKGKAEKCQPDTAVGSCDCSWENRKVEELGCCPKK